MITVKEEHKNTQYRRPDETISLDELKSFLWGAATRLRGQIDAAGYKEYIFPLLFFKRISDVYDEQFESFVAEGGEEYAGMQAKELAIRIPDGAHWRDVREVTENVGQRLVEAFIAIEQANPGVEADGRVIGGLDGIFGPKDGWTNKNKMPDHIITSLIEDFSRYNLGLSSCPADEMGQAYEYLVGKFADDAGNTAQEFYTNRTVVTLMAEILQPDESIYDPTCGSGGMLVKCLDFLRQKGLPWQGVKVFGQEINALTASIARMNLYLNGVEDFSIVREDTLAHPAFVDGSHLRKFDIVLANPPYSIKTWNREAFMNDKWGRNMWGTPIQARADYAFIQHIIASMNEKTGRSATLLPHGVLNREEDKDIRINHVKSDTIDAIIGLGRNLFYNSGLESFIFICSNCKPKSRKNKILFIEAEKCTHKEGKQAYLFPEDIDKILAAYNSEEDIPGFSKHVSIEDVLANDGNLNIKSYVKTLEESDDKTLLDNLVELTSCQNKLSASLCQLPYVEDNPSFLNFNIDRSSFDKSNWKRVKLSDVAEEYSVRIDNPSESEFDFFIGSDCIGQYDFRIHKRSDASAITSTQKRFSAGDYLLVRRSLYGSDFRERAPRADFDGVCSADIITIREKEGIIANGFLIYVLYQKKLWDFIVSNSNGGLTRRIKWKQLAEYEFDLPSIEEQKIIAEKLWAAYRLKESYKKLLAATEEMVKSQFIEMFGNPVTNNKGWNTLPIKDVAPETSSLEKQTGKVWILNLDMIESNTGKVVEKVFENDSNLLSVAPFDEGNVLYSKLRPYLNKVVIPDGKGYATTELVPLRPNQKLLNLTFFSHLLRGDDFVTYANSISTGTKMPRMPLNDLRKFQCILPPMEKQNEFEEIAHQADKSGSVGLKSGLNFAKLLILR